MTIEKARPLVTQRNGRGVELGRLNSLIFIVSRLPRECKNNLQGGDCMTFSDVVRRFDGVKSIGNNRVQCRCPCHADDKASLSITLSDNGRILFYDHAGCSTKDILDRVGLTFADITPEKRERKTYFDHNAVKATPHKVA